MARSRGLVVKTEDSGRGLGFKPPLWRPFFWIKAWNKYCGKLKQWLLAGEFSEFEYSRETRRFFASASTRQNGRFRKCV
jgi:hypothetical protein